MESCKYCGRTGFNGKKGLATHRRHSNNCLLKWEQQQNKIEQSKTKVRCQICGKYLRNISNTHLKLHNITQQEYKKTFPNSHIFSDGLLEEQKQKREKKIIERYGNKKNCSCSKDYLQKKYGITQGLLKYENWVKNMGQSLEKLVKKHGKEKGQQKYHNFCTKMKGKCTLQWYIKKYGKNIGEKLYQQSCKIKSFTHKKEWYLKKYGNEQGLKIFQEINKRKSPSLTNLVSKYGENLGKQKYEQMKSKSYSGFEQSKIAMQLFHKIKKLFPNEKMFYDKNPKEFGRYLSSLKKYCFLDFYMPDRKKVIEFYGDYWHCNPQLYNDDQIVFYPQNKTFIAKEIREKDKERIEAIKKQLKCEVIIVWENDYKRNKKDVLKIVIDFLNQPIQK